METARRDLARVVKRVGREREGEKSRREEEEKTGEVGRRVRRRGGIWYLWCGRPTLTEQRTRYLRFDGPLRKSSTYDSRNCAIQEQDLYSYLMYSFLSICSSHRDLFRFSRVFPRWFAAGDLA
jgi:hypothetical protein